MKNTEEKTETISMYEALSQLEKHAGFLHKTIINMLDFLDESKLEEDQKNKTNENNTQ